MTDAADPGPFAPDNPARRLPLVLAISVLLVLLALLGLGRLLHSPARQAAKRTPLRARIYELPASRGTTAAEPAPRVRRPAPAQTAHRRPRAQARRPAQQPHHSRTARAHQHPNASAPHVSAPKGAVLARPSHARRTMPATGHRPAQPHRHHAINWATLQSQINAAVRRSDSSPPQIHDPHTLVARFYIAALLRKLQRIGDMNYPTRLKGMPVIKLVIGAHGELLQLTLLRSSGNDKLDRDALQIARESAPFAPFPDKLKRQTPHIEFVCYMKFVGYRQIHAGY
jgi:protein TonB